MVTFDFTITLGNIIETGVLLVGGASVIFRTGGDIRVMKNEMRHLSGQVGILNTAFEQLGMAMTRLAVTDERLQSQQKQIDELRRGIGFIVPMAPNGA